MTEAVKTPAAKAPWHFWVMCAVAVVWNGFGAYDFIMSKTQGDAYFRKMGMSEAMIAHYHAMPGWMFAVWVVGVWGAVLGTVLMIVRSRYAVWAFAASLAGAAVSAAYQFLSPTPGESPGVMPAVIVLLAAMFLAYAARQARQGLLR